MRRDPRYPTSIPCLLDVPGGPSIAGVIVDISAGGAGIETLSLLPDEFTLSFDYENQRLALPCVQRHSRDLWAKRRIHAQFRSPTAAQRSVLDDLIEALKTAPSGEQRDSVWQTLGRLLRR